MSVLSVCPSKGEGDKVNSILDELDNSCLLSSEKESKIAKYAKELFYTIILSVCCCTMPIVISASIVIATEGNDEDYPLLKDIAIISSIFGVVVGALTFVCEKTCNYCKSPIQESLV
ncbi:MAG: hypothetical protein K940chlam5_00527 [Candidatus Anoxychlamydiales bacterium]|nr:hypothetical protein [Candidatus Anoxychlamydiales bacterium]